MSSKRLLSLASLFMLLSMLLAACGGDTATPTPVPVATDTTAPAPPTTAPAPPTTAPAPPTDTAMAAAPTTAPTAMAPTIAPTAMAPADTAVPATATAATVMTPTVAPIPAAVITATDALYAIADCNSGGYQGTVKSIQAVDDTTVKFTLCSPDPAFPAKIAFSSLEIQSAAHLQATNGISTTLLDQPLGTGPYMLKEWVRGDHLTLVANPNYWGPAPKLKTVTFKWNPSATARLTSLRSGDVDGIDNPDTHDFTAIQSDASLKLYPREALNVFYLGFNNTVKPLDNEKVRQAIAMGIDRAAIVKKFYPSGSTVADFFTPCAIPGGCEGDKWYATNQAAAKKMLADAGFPNGFNITLSFRNVVRGYLPSPDKVAQELQAQLKGLGITATIDQEASATFIDNAQKGKLQMFLLGWGADYPDQTDFLDYHFGKGASPQFGTKFDDLTAVLQQAAMLADQAARNKLYATANNLIKQHVPMVPIAHGGSADAFKKTVVGAYAAVIGGEHFKEMSIAGKDSIVWSQNAEPNSLYCADESDGETLRACEQIFDSLLSYQPTGTAVQPGLADLPTANSDLTEWTLKLHAGVKFSDGTALTAKDVVLSYAVQWDAANKLHVGRTGDFTYWSGLFGGFLNPKPAAP